MGMMLTWMTSSLWSAVQDELIDLLDRAGRGDRVAFARIYERTSARLFAVVRRVLPRAELAEDALQEAFVKIWQRSAKYDSSIASPMAWLATIARNQAIDVRRRFAERLSGLSDELDDAVPSGLPSPAALAEISDELRALSHCLGQLPGDRREMILLAYYQGFSREELSTRFSRPVTTVKTLLRRSLIVLKECLDGRG